MKNFMWKIFYPFDNKKYELENKWGHRLIKVLYVTILIISFIISIFWYYFWINDFIINNSQDYISRLEYDIKNWATSDEIIQAYPEIKNNKKLVDELMFDILHWATLDEVKQAYPELSWQAPTANTSEDLNQQAISDIINGMPIEEFDTYYPELASNKQIFEQLSIDIKAGIPIEEISNYYPELSWQSPTSNTSNETNLDTEKIKNFIEKCKQLWKSKEEIKTAYDIALSAWIFNIAKQSTSTKLIQEEWIFIKLWNIWIFFTLFFLSIITTYFISLILQLIYYKIFIYIIYWKK